MTDTDADIAARMGEIGRRAQASAAVVAEAGTEAKNAALHGAARALHARMDEILKANRTDMEAAEGLSAAKRDRLALDEARVAGIAEGLEAIADLPDPVGSEIARWTRPNGLDIARIRTPLGVIGVIYESRPNVTADAGALCLKAGNASVLRPGSESTHSSGALHACLVEGLAGAGLPEDAVQMAVPRARAAVGEMLKGLGGTLDVIVPRGGRSLVERVQKEARIPVFAHLEGICHIYVDASADAAMARRIVVNAKMRRTGICGAAETLLVDEACAPTHLAPLITALHEAGCAVRGDKAAQACAAYVKPATEEDWHTEYLDAVISVKCVAGVEDALRHIAQYGSAHTDTIVAEDSAAAERFLSALDSAIVMHNASTQFADGGEFGMGAEIGIATGRFHARGPVGLEQLTSFKYVVRGSGQCR